MTINMQAKAPQRQFEHTWRSWTRSAISCAKKRQSERGERGVAVTMTSDGLMAKLRAASFRCVLSGAEFRNDGGERFGPTVAGLFLAFPSIMPASVTLVEKHGGEDKAVNAARGSAGTGRCRP